MRKIFLLLAVCVCFFVTVPVFCFADSTAALTAAQAAALAAQSAAQTADQTADQTVDQTAEEVPASKYDQIYSLIVKYVFGNQPLTDSQAIAVDLLSLIGCIFVFSIPFIVVFFIIRRISS